MFAADHAVRAHTAGLDATLHVACFIRATDRCLAAGPMTGLPPKTLNEALFPTEDHGTLAVDKRRHGRPGTCPPRPDLDQVVRGLTAGSDTPTAWTNHCEVGGHRPTVVAQMKGGGPRSE
jgi:hypothetical protein